MPIDMKWVILWCILIGQSGQDARDILLPVDLKSFRVFVSGFLLSMGWGFLEKVFLVWDKLAARSVYRGHNSNT